MTLLFFQSASSIWIALKNSFLLFKYLSVSKLNLDCITVKSSVSVDQNVCCHKSFINLKEIEEPASSAQNYTSMMAPPIH